MRQERPSFHSNQCFTAPTHNTAAQAKAVLTEALEAVADRGYFSSREILACHEAGLTVTLPKR